jgi:alanine-glyoxylate transaminase/serine-glyoxylate transaminase/serine-pyruvate transaminase
MDDVVQLGRRAFLTESSHCFAISALPSGGLEAVLNSLLQADDRVAIGGSPRFVDATADLVKRLGGEPVAADADATYVLVPHVDPFHGTRTNLKEIAAQAHSRQASLIVEATLGLAACELRVDDWGIDVCVAGADHAVGAPSGTSLVTYTEAVAARLQARTAPPRTSYLDLIQLQAYWSPERLNHHTAPTSLVYALREALRLVHLEGLAERWHRHADVGRALRQGLDALGLDATGDPPYAIVHLPSDLDESTAWRRLLDDFGVYVTRLGPRTWRLGLIGADARRDAVEQVLHGLESVLQT